MGPLTHYIAAAMDDATYEILPEGEGIYAEIPALAGVWAQADTVEACRRELQAVLEGWIILGLRMGHPMPALSSGLQLEVDA